MSARSSIGVGASNACCAVTTYRLHGVYLGDNLAHSVCGSIRAQCEQISSQMRNVEGAIRVERHKAAPSNHRVICKALRACFCIARHSTLNPSATTCTPPAGSRHPSSGTLVSHMTGNCQHYLRALYSRSPLYLLVRGQTGWVGGERNVHVDGRPSRRWSAGSWRHWRSTIRLTLLLLLLPLQRLHRRSGYTTA